MAEERNFGVTEARVGLTLLTCLLIALGFAILQRLSDAGTSQLIESPQRERPEGVASDFQDEPSIDRDQPQVLPAQSGESTPRVALHERYLEPAPQSEAGASTESQNALAPAGGEFSTRPPASARDGGTAPRTLQVPFGTP